MLRRRGQLLNTDMAKCWDNDLVVADALTGALASFCVEPRCQELGDRGSVRVEQRSARSFGDGLRVLRLGVPHGGERAYRHASAPAGRRDR